MLNTEEKHVKRRAIPIAEVFSADGLVNLGAVYRWNTGEEEIFWDDEVNLSPDEFPDLKYASM